MKKMKAMKKLLFNTIILIVYAGSTSLTFASARDLQKTFTWNYKINNDALVQVNNYDCDLVIHTWDKDEAEYRLSVKAETRSDEDAQLLENFIRNLLFSHSSSSVSFDNRFWESRNTIMGRMTMKLKGGKNVSLTAFEITGELWIPKGCKFKLGSKYSEINMEDFSGPLNIDLYNDNFYGGKLGSNAEITDKYSTIEFKDIKDLRADLYNSKFDAGDCGKLDIQSKYSKIICKNSGDLEINGYNDKYSFIKTGNISFTAKYSDLETESSGRAELDCYEGTISLKEVKDVRIQSKYADFRFDVAANCSISSSYETKITAGKLKSLDISESKYCTYKVDEIVNSLSESDGYQDKFYTFRLGEDFKGIKVNGKYLELSLEIPKTTDYRFKANIKYPDFDINESAFKPVVKIEKGSQIEYDAIKGTEKDGMPLIEVNGYQVTLKIREY
jgi:hypothetical protein